MEMDERPAVQVQRGLAKVAEEPGEAGQHHEQADTALRPPVPREDPAPDQNEADGEIGDGQLEVGGLIGDPLGRDPESDTEQ
jgi:hypothetical protein